MGKIVVTGKVKRYFSSIPGHENDLIHIDDEAEIELNISEEDIREAVMNYFGGLDSDSDVEALTNKIVNLLTGSKTSESPNLVSEPKVKQGEEDVFGVSPALLGGKPDGTTALEQSLKKEKKEQPEKSCEHIGTLMIGLSGGCYTKCIKCGEMIHNSKDSAQQPKKEERVIDWEGLLLDMFKYHKQRPELLEVVERHNMLVNIVKELYDKVNKQLPEKK